MFCESKTSQWQRQQKDYLFCDDDMHAINCILGPHAHVGAPSL